MKHDLDSFIYPESTAVDGIAASIQSRARGGYLRFGKRILDILLVALAAPFLLPVIGLLALLVMRDGAAPFFGHKRIGKDGREFRCWKIRSMVPNAEEKLKTWLGENPAARAEWEQNFKLENDPRITPLGHILRKTSLDELPQLWNILKGEMSWVGPRPVTAKELVFYGPAVAHYKAMPPGLTGLWQVSGRNDISYAERVGLDVRYYRDCSFLLDTGIILRTAKAVVMRTGR